MALMHYSIAQLNVPNIGGDDNLDRWDYGARCMLFGVMQV